MWNVNDIEWLDIELTSYCNIKCPGCLRQVMQEHVGPVLNKNYIKLKDLKKWITAENLPNLKTINFCGSVDEPTSHPEIIEIVDYFREFINPRAENAGVSIATNGSTRNAEFWKKLGDRRISVFWGIDGIDQESLEKYRIGSNFKKVQENFRAFIKAGGHATWQFIVFDHNEHLIEAAEKMANDEGFKRFRTIYSHRTNQGKPKEHSNLKEILISDLIDRLTILTIKKDKLSEPENLSKIHKEHYMLEKIFNSLDYDLNDLKTKLQTTNIKIWDLIDKIKEYEKNRDLNENYVIAARDISKYKKERTDIKNTINDLTNFKKQEVGLL